MATLDDAFACFERAAEFGLSIRGTDPTPAVPEQIAFSARRRLTRP